MFTMTHQQSGPDRDQEMDARIERENAEYVLKDIFVRLDEIADSPEGLSDRERRQIRHIQKDVAELRDEVEENEVP